MISIEINDQGVQTLLNTLASRLGDMTPAMREVGEQLTRGTKKRFAVGADWNGTPWLPNAQTTVLRYMGRTKGNFKKNGSFSKKGMIRLLGKEPLTGESRKLRTTIFYQAGFDSVTIASPEEYAATQHFGALRGAFGRTVKGAPIPWGTIPPRRFMPVNPDGTMPTPAADLVMGILQNYLEP